MANYVIPSGTVVGDVTIPCDVPFCVFESATYLNYNDAHVSGDGIVYICYVNNLEQDAVICASETTPNPVRFNNNRSVYSNNITPFSLTIDNKTVYYSPVTGGSSLTNFTPAPTGRPTVDLISSGIWRHVAWAMIYGGFTGYPVTYSLENCSASSENPAVIQPNAAITNMEFIPDSGYSFVSVSIEIMGDGYPPGTPISYVFDPDTGKLEIGPISSAISVHVKAYGDPYAEIDGESTIPGGGTIQIPGLPSLSATSTGIIGLFAPTIAQMQALSDFMWTDFGGQGTTEIEVLSEIVQAIKRAISNPLDYIIGLNIIPSQGLSVGAAQTVKFGFVSSGISMQKLSNQYFTVDCGTISFPTLCGDTFLDYAPYSKFSIYLPYIGFKELDANDCVGHTIGVYYHGDVVTGGITAYLTKDGSVMYQFAGCCALNIPLSADGWGSTIAGAVQIASSVVAAGATGGVAGAAKAAAQGAAAVAANPSLMSPKVSHSGAVSGGAGLMGIQTPFIIREAVRFHSTTGFNKLSGYPAFYYRNLSSVAGYTKVLDLHLHGIPATQDEIAEIESLLKEGVIF